MKINGAVAVVTGGAKGLGLAIAKLLQLLGATVIVLDYDDKALSELPNDLFGKLVDVTQPESAKLAVSDVIKQYHQIDLLINNAGVIYSEPFVNIANASGIKFNLDSVFIMTSVVVEQMVMLRTKGVIVNISSISANGNEGQTAYSAAKAAVNALTIVWAKELGRWGIRCNAIAPGFIATESTQQAISKTSLDHVKDNTPLRRLGKPNEVAQAVVSNVENDFITGIILKVDGGLRI